MELLLIILMLFLLFGGGFGFDRYCGSYGPGIAISTALIIIIVVLLLFSGIPIGRRYGFLISTAFADTIVPMPMPAVPSPTSVFIGDALNTILALLVPIVSGFLAAALLKLRAKLGFQATAQDKANMEAELQTALQFGIAKSLPAIKAAGWDNINVHSAVVADAANFMLERFPDRSVQIIKAAAPIGVLEPEQEPLDAVKDSLSARLPAAVVIAAASPATPPGMVYRAPSSGQPIIVVPPPLVPELPGVR